MIKKVNRYFLEVTNKDYKKDTSANIPEGCEIYLDHQKDYNLNKFFYKQIGIDHFWRDRLIWTNKEWLRYTSNVNLETWILKKNNELVGFYEQEFHQGLNEVELINMGILKEYRKNKLGSYLLKHSIKRAFVNNPFRMWVHTCSLDHKHALQNYKSKGFKLFKEEVFNFVA